MPIIPSSLTPLASLGELEHSEEFESNASEHDHECDEWYGCNDDEKECIVEEIPLGESCGMLVHVVSPPCLELVEYMSPIPLNLMPTSLNCSSTTPSLKRHSSRPPDYHVMCNLSLDLGHVNNYFHMLSVIWSLGIFGGLQSLH